MKWPAKHTRIEPTAGTTRINSCFAWLPVYISGIFVWLTWFEVLQVYRITNEKVTIDGVLITFFPGKWINITKRCKV